MATLYVTADRKRFVPAGDPDAAIGIAPVDVDALGLRDAYEDFIKPKPKAISKAANKMAAKPSNKGR